MATSINDAHWADLAGTTIGNNDALRARVERTLQRFDDRAIADITLMVRSAITTEAIAGWMDGCKAAKQAAPQAEGCAENQAHKRPWCKPVVPSACIGAADRALSEGYITGDAAFWEGYEVLEPEWGDDDDDDGDGAGDGDGDGAGAGASH